MSITATATTTLALDDNSINSCDSVTVTSTTTVKKNEATQNFRGTCTAKFLKNGEQVAPDYNGSSFQINYGSLFPKTINYIHIGDSIQGYYRYFDFEIEPPRGNGSYSIPLTNSNTRFSYGLHGFNVDRGDMVLTVIDGNCSGTFKLVVTGNPTGGGDETLDIEDGEFDIYAI